MLKNVKPRFQAWLVVYLNSKKQNASFREWPFCVQKNVHVICCKNKILVSEILEPGRRGEEDRGEEKRRQEAARTKQTRANVCG